MADILEELIADPARRLEIGHWARKLAFERYNSEKNTYRLLELTRSAVRSAAGRG